MTYDDLWRFVLVRRKRVGMVAWEPLQHYVTRDAAMSAADVYASSHIDEEVGLLELTTFVRAEIVTRVEKL